MSVLAAMKSTRSRAAAIIVFTALQPAPPTPTTRILAACLLCSNWLIETAFLSEDFFQPLAHPPLHLLVDVIVADSEDAPVLILGTVDDESDTGGVDRALHHVDQPAHAARDPASHRQANHLFRQFRHPRQERGPAGDHD